MRLSLHILAAAFLAWGLWLAEIFLVKGWFSLEWLNGFNWSAIPICMVIAASCAFSVPPVQASHGQASQRPALFSALAAAMFLAAFAASRAALDDIFSSWQAAPPSLGSLLQLILSGAAVSVALPLSARWLIAPVRTGAAFAIAAVLLLAMPASALAIWLFPAPTGQTDTLHAIKMGYPVFWTALFVPLVLRWVSKRPSQE
jgi:hypothetical protein